MAQSLADQYSACHYTEPMETTNIEKHNYDGHLKDMDYNYKGLAIHAGKGIHEYVSHYLEENVSKDTSILVLGAGTGSFDHRLHDLGFCKLISADINFDNYRYKDPRVNFVSADLNQPFAEKFSQRFDLVIAIEIVEHLYSTRDFLVNVDLLLKEDGKLLLTTPNPRSQFSRWRFFTIGYHARFYGIPQLYEHINPIHIDIFRHHCYFTGLEISELESFDIEVPSSRLKSLAKVVMAAFMNIIDWTFRNKLQHEKSAILFMLITKKASS